MKHFTSSRFWNHYENLPKPVQTLADKNLKLLKIDHRHPSLRFKKIGKYRSVRIGLGHRALAVETLEGFIWFWIGSHSEYDRMIN